jgi:Co/Zn/Cd efflux system component
MELENGPGTGAAAIRRVVLLVAVLNLAYFGVEFAVARRIGSVSLFADSIDFLEDATVNLLVLVALGWTARRRAAVGVALASLLLVPAIAALWTAWEKMRVPVAPHAGLLSGAGAGALVVNVTCALLLARFRRLGGSLVRVAYLSARNDALANVAIVGAGALTALTGSRWPDVAVGLAIFAMNVGAVREVLAAASAERAEKHGP